MAGALNAFCNWSRGGDGEYLITHPEITDQSAMK